MQLVSNEWSAQEFYHLVRYKAWKGDAEKKYNEIMALKHSK